MSYLTLRDSVLGMLSDHYHSVDSSIEAIEYGGRIHSFFLKFQSEESMNELWQEMVSAIAFYFQSNLEEDFEKWNLYVFFLAPGEVSKELKYKIENDPISSRKIVVENYNNEATKTIISDHITNDSLNLAAKKLGAVERLERNPLISEELKKFAPKLSSKKKKSNDPYIIETLAAIEKRLKS